MMTSTTRNVLVSLGIAAGFLYLAFRSVSLDELGNALAEIQSEPIA